MNPIRVLSVFGTRPEAIKMSPLVKVLQDNPAFDSMVCVTAQHREMLDQVLKVFDIKPDYDLDIMEERQRLDSIVSTLVSRLTNVYKNARPDLVLVHGDTITTLCASLSAFFFRTKIGHVEAGLRSGNLHSPFPEEFNRQVVSRSADLHFCPTNGNFENLIKEGIDESKIYITGNTVIDALRTTVKDKYKFECKLLNKLNFNKKIVVVTCHRRENWNHLSEICQAIKSFSSKCEDVEIVFPVHPNPKVKTTVYKELDKCKQIHLIEPIGVFDMHNLMSKCCIVMTDSGGLQEEAPYFGKPVLVLRTETERPEAVKAGTVKIVGVSKDTIESKALELINDSNKYFEMSSAISPYGMGNSSIQIAMAIMKEFGIYK